MQSQRYFVNSILRSITASQHLPTFRRSVASHAPSLHHRTPSSKLSVLLRNNQIINPEGPLRNMTIQELTRFPFKTAANIQAPGYSRVFFATMISQALPLRPKHFQFLQSTFQPCGFLFQDSEQSRLFFKKHKLLIFSQTFVTARRKFILYFIKPILIQHRLINYRPPSLCFVKVRNIRNHLQILNPLLVNHRIIRVKRIFIFRIIKQNPIIPLYFGRTRLSVSLRAGRVFRHFAIAPAASLAH